jgi:hypothetical protein
MRVPKVSKVARKYETGVEFHQAYIDILLRLAGYRLSDLYTSILAYSSYYGSLNKEIKQRVAKNNNTSLQVISNGITKLRKLGVLTKNEVNPKLIPKDKEAISLTLVLGVETSKESSDI